MPARVRLGTEPFYRQFQDGQNLFTRWRYEFAKTLIFGVTAPYAVDPEKEAS